jgi:isoquinoline 1-oxidoreductase alpha subunit
LLRDNPSADDTAIDEAMSGNICRCGMYARIKRGIRRVASTGVQQIDPQEVQHG